MSSQYPEWKCGNCDTTNVSLVNCAIPLNLLRDVEAMVEWIDANVKYPQNCYCHRCWEDVELERTKTQAEIEAQCEKIAEDLRGD